MPHPDPVLASLFSYLDASPSPYHAAAEAAARLVAAGFTPVDERAAWPSSGRQVLVRGGSLVAWTEASAATLADGFRIIGAHTDSPNLRLKPHPDTNRVGYQQLAVEVYGGALWNSWLDRDLGLSGRVTVRDGEASSATQLLKVDRALARIPQLAIHLDRAVNESGLSLNPQQHLVPVWGVGAADAEALRRFVADELGLDRAAVLGWDLMFHDITPAGTFGRTDDFISSARLDNQLSCWAAVEAITTTSDPKGVAVVCLFDHEEIGSESASGAAGALLPTILERISLAAGQDRAEFLQTVAASFCVSADGGHATHPNYPDRHDPGHLVLPNAGPVLKFNADVRYATDAESTARFRLIADAAGVATQDFVMRSDMRCGSTIGPITSARLGIPTIDIGVPLLSMHSARELCGRADPGPFAAVLGAALAR